jgi:site-specific recombinase XerD
MTPDLTDPFLDWMRRRRYADQTVRIARPVVRAFLAHLEAGGRTVAAADLVAVNAYLAHRRRLCGPPGIARSRGRQREPRHALRRFLAFLAERGLIAEPRWRPLRDPCAVPGFEPLLREYRTFLLDHRGFAVTTVENYLDAIGRLCRALARRRIREWDRVTPEILYRHLERRARRLGRAALRKTQSAWRGFFRYLLTTRRATRDLAAVLVRARVFSLAPLPRVAPPEAIAALLRDVEGDRPLQIRDRAILALFLAYGLRGREIAQLTLDDLRWRAGVLVLRRRKNGRDLTLPLLPAVALALARYVREVRPADSAYRQVFLDAHGRRPFARGAGRILRPRIRRLGLGFPPHALRHAWAAQLVNRGCPLAHLAVLLGHADLDSTRL